MAYYCPNCGEPVRNADRFCQSCGFSLSDEPVDVEALRRVHTKTAGNVQYQETAADPFYEEEPLNEPATDSYEEYRRHTYDYSGKDRESFHRNTYEHSGVEYFRDPQWPVRSRVAAALFAILLGNLGVHKFYLGKIGEGILMLMFSWTCVPGLIGLIEGIIYLTQSDEEFSWKNHVRTE